MSEPSVVDAANPRYCLSQTIADGITDIASLMFDIMDSPYMRGPVVLTLLLPFFFALLVYVSALIFYLHQKFPMATFWRMFSTAVWTENDFYKAGRYLIAAFWDMQGWLWFAYEVDGLEKLPTSGPALLIYYHGAIPIDYYYLCAKVLLAHNRNLRSVVDRLLIKIPGLKTFYKAFLCTPGSVESCVDELKAGHMLGLSPGGVYESQFSDHRYRLMWRRRNGFAKIAIESGVPVYPVFTRNIRESFRTISIFAWPGRFLYTWIKFPWVPLYGGFPVKLTTYIGDPIVEHISDCDDMTHCDAEKSKSGYHDSNFAGPDSLRIRRIEAFRRLCICRLDALISKHQSGNLPGSIWTALRERWTHSVGWLWLGLYRTVKYD